MAANPRTDRASGFEPVRAWNELLADADLAAETASRLDELQGRRSLNFGNRQLCRTLRPNLLTAERQRRAVAAARGVHSALVTLERALLKDGELRRELELEPQEERLALADNGLSHSSPSMRLDSFFADEVRYVECNAESPAGMAYEDMLAAVFRELPVMRAFRRHYRVRSMPVRTQQYRCLLRCFREWGREPEPVLAIVDWSGLPTAPEFDLFKDYFERRGLRTVICEPAELEFRRGRLHAGSRPVNLIYKRVLTSELLARPEAARGLVEAHLAGAVCIVNSFRGKLLHKKVSLALLSDDRYQQLYSREQREAVARHIPWTRRLREGSSSAAGRPIKDLVQHVVRNRPKLVLKPNDEYGGKGVVLGWTVNDEEWERAVREGLERPSVVQEAVPVPREPFPVVLENSVKVLDLAVDMDPYLFHGRPGGMLTRLSSSELLNVTAGTGSIVPTFLVEERW